MSGILSASPPPRVTHLLLGVCDVDFHSFIPLLSVVVGILPNHFTARQPDQIISMDLGARGSWFEIINSDLCGSRYRSAELTMLSIFHSSSTAAMTIFKSAASPQGVWGAAPVKKLCASAPLCEQKPNRNRIVVVGCEAAEW